MLHQMFAKDTTPVFYGALIIGLVVIVGFEVWMFIRAAWNKRISRGRKLAWLIAMLFIHPFAALAYLFTDFRKR